MNSADQTSPLKRRLSDLLGYGTVAAAVALLFFFLVMPVSVIEARAFFNKGELTYRYFPQLISNEMMMAAIGNSLMLGLFTTLLATLLSFPLALINVKWEFPGKGILMGLLLVPMVMPPFVGAIGILRFFARRGSVNLGLMGLGWIEQPIDWLGPETSFWAVVVLEVLHLYPIMYLNLSASLANVDPSMEEMATTLGAPKWKQLRDIVWPLARPGYFAGAIIVFIWALTDLGTPLLVGYHQTIPVQIFNMITDVNENPVGYALVCLVIAMTVCFFLLSKFALGGKKYEMMAKGHVSSGKKQASWASMPLIYGLVIGTVVLALIPHLAVLITALSHKWFMTVLPEQYTLEHFSQVFQTELSLTGIKNSFLFAGLSTLLDLVLGLIIAYVIVVRKLIPLPGLLDGLVMIPLALPGIVLAFGYVVTYSDTFLDPLHNPVPLLVIAYAVRRLPYMVRSAAAGLQQMSPSLEEASTTFGASRFYTLRKITVPLVMANLIAGALLCFSYAMLDVSDSLILAMKEKFYPLTKAIYVLFLEQGSGEFLASSLGVIGMVILAACIMGASLLLGKKMGELFRS
ncbi:MAG: iron ABC transporter permease [Proteobacteria bacterium]|nr:iron ABC transporter permease [Pseudomonadota bacterium]